MKRLFLTILTTLLTVQLMAQVTGVVIDSKTRKPLEFVNVYYDGRGYGEQSDENGQFVIKEDSTWHELTVSTMGYERQVVKLGAFGKNKNLKIRLTPEGSNLQEVTVTTKRTRYSRKNNPAVELMRKVIAHKKSNDLHAKDFFTFTTYEKMTFSVNEVTDKIFEMDEAKAWAFLKNHVERHPKTGTLILPLTVDEQLSHTFYRRSPKSEKELIKAKSSRGINELINTGDILTTILKDCFTDVNIYDEECRLLQFHIKSPIANSAISFYRYYIQDTLFFRRSTPEDKERREYNPLDFYVSRDEAHSSDLPHDSVVVLGFTPNNQQDIAFNGNIYIMMDSSYQVKTAELHFPKQSNVNFVEDIRIDQYYEDLPTGERVCVNNDMLVNLKVTSWLTKVLVQRTVRNFDYTFDEIPPNVFKRIKGTTYTEPDATMHTDDQYWAQYRKEELSESESQIGGLLKKLTELKYFKPVMIGVKALIENYVETSDSTATNKFDFGPINTTISFNDYDRWRFRLSGFTTAHFSLVLLGLHRLWHALQEPLWMGRGRLLIQQESLSLARVPEEQHPLLLPPRCHYALRQVRTYRQGQHVHGFPHLEGRPVQPHPRVEGDVGPRMVQWRQDATQIHAHTTAPRRQTLLSTARHRPHGHGHRGHAQPQPRELAPAPHTGHQHV